MMAIIGPLKIRDDPGPGLPLPTTIFCGIIDNIIYDN
jgi:hypothetical protein